MLVVMTVAITEPPDLVHRIRHAESYPFARPACSYLFADGGMRPLRPDRRADACEDRIPILAVGANASPDRLAAKFGSDDVIPVMRAILEDFVIVFAGHFCGYGAIPATLYPCPGAHTRIWINWLTPAQRQIMHRSEGVIDHKEAAPRYDYVELDGLDLRPDGMAPITRAGAYLVKAHAGAGWRTAALCRDLFGRQRLSGELSAVDPSMGASPARSGRRLSRLHGAGFAGRRSAPGVVSSPSPL